MQQVNFKNLFGDKRIEERAEQFHNRLFSSGSRSIQSLSISRAEQKAFYRLLRNDKVSEDNLIAEMTSRCSASVSGRVVLAIQDTTEINLSSHFNRLNKETGVGTLDGAFPKQVGFKVHPSLVLDALTGFPLGFSHLRLWHRDFSQPSKQERDYSKLPISEKESYKWIETSNKSKDTLVKAQAVVIVQDREGDIFDQYLDVPDDRTYLLIRSKSNRNIGKEEKLWDKLSQQPVCGRYMVNLGSDSHSSTPARNAEIEVRFLQTPIINPKNKSGAQHQTVYVVEAKEVNSSVKEPVLWRLITTWPVEDFVTARMIIEWYTSRWIIEEVFRLLKKEGFNLEASELESGWAIRKLCVMLLDTIMKVLQMHIAYHSPEGENPGVHICFNDEQQECLKGINQKLQGKTKALQNPYSPTDLKWATWIISRSGGWKGYQSQRPPGMTTIWKGLQHFNDIYEGWSLFKDMGTR